MLEEFWGNVHSITDKKKGSQIGPLNDLSVDQTLRPVSGPLGKTPVRDKIASVFNNIGIHKFA